MKFSKYVLLLSLLSSTFSQSCTGRGKGASMGFAYLIPDSPLFYIPDNRYVTVKNDKEKKEFIIDFVFEKGCEEENNKKYAFNINFSGPLLNFEDKLSNYFYYYDFYNQLKFLNSSREEIKKNEYTYIDDYLILTTQKVFVSYSDLPEEGISLFLEDRFPRFQIAEAFNWQWKNITTGNIYIESNNYDSDYA